MSPQQLAQAALRNLLGDLELDLEALDKLAARIAQDPGPSTEPAGDRGARAALAVDLHQYYTALESALERVARTVDGIVPSGPRSHDDLLRQAAHAIAGVRPAIVDSKTFGELTQLLAFRHFFRHAYLVELDWSRLEEHRARVGRTHPELQRGFAALTAHLVATLGALAL